MCFAPVKSVLKTTIPYRIKGCGFRGLARAGRKVLISKTVFTFNGKTWRNYTTKHLQFYAIRKQDERSVKVISDLSFVFN